MNGLRWRKWHWAVLVGLLLAAAYLGTYFALAEPLYYVSSESGVEFKEVSAGVAYGFGPDDAGYYLAVWFFSPIHELDRRLSSRWQTVYLPTKEARKKTKH